jgi:hypothetical protein
MKRSQPAPSALGREVSSLWLIPLGLVGLPFLLAALGRLCGALGSAAAGEALVSWAQAYGRWPLQALGLRSAFLEESLLGYVAAGILYSSLVFLAIAGVRLISGAARTP